MNDRTCLTIVLAAGEGTRMRASRPKVLHAIGGRPLIARKLIEIAALEQAVAIAHGCTCKGTDPVRLEIETHALNPSMTVLAPARGVALLAVAGGRGEHPVLRRDPAATLAGHPPRHALLHRRRADHARLALGDERRAGGRVDEAGIDPRRAQVAGAAVIGARRHAASSR